MTEKQHSSDSGDGLARRLRQYLPQRWPFPPRGRVKWSAVRRSLYRFVRRKWVVRSLIGVAAVFLISTVAILGLWWRLSSGPIEFDLATSWLKAAIEQNFGPKYKVAIGGTQFERDENGHPSLRIRDIAVRDETGAIVAAAPKAEIGLSGSSLLTGNFRASSLNLVGAELSVRIETDGQVTIFAGANSKPLARAPLPEPPVTAPAPDTPDASALPQGLKEIGAALAWLDRIGATDLDSYDLRQLGLKNGNLTVDDRRTGKRWTFTDINVGLSRPAQGGIIFRISSDAPDRAWQISAAIRPIEGDVRAVGIEARQVPAHDLLLAMRVSGVEAEFPISASIRAELLTGGVVRAARGQVVAGAGFIRDPGQVGAEMLLERADIRAVWDARQKSLVMPFHVQAQGLQMTMMARAQPDPQENGAWRLSITRGDGVIDPIILSPDTDADRGGFSFNRVAINARIDPARQRIVVDQGDFGREDTRSLYNVGVAVTGTLDYSGADPRLNFGVAGTRMPVAVLKRLWPKPVAPPVRNWVDAHISAGTVERLLIAGNMSLPVMFDPAVPIPDDGLSIEIDTSATVLRPVETLPEIRDADLSVKITGNTARISLGRGTLDVGNGRRLNIANGHFDVPDTHPKTPAAKALFRIDGSVAAAAALLASDHLRDAAAMVLDPASSRGTMSAQIALDLVLAKKFEDVKSRYALTADLNNFSAERLVMGQKVESPALRVTANSSGYAVRGDIKINGTAANLDFRKDREKPKAEIRLTASLDAAARRRIGIDFGSAVTGSVPVKLAGEMEAGSSDVRLDVEADFTDTAIDNLLPGWVKPAGREARATFQLVRDGKAMRFEELAISGNGASVKGTVELEADGDLVAANFPVFGLSDGDKATLKVDRNGGVMRVTLRGDVYDGREAVKSLLSSSHEQSRKKAPDVDLDIRLGAVAGFNGETLRGLELRFNRRSGQVRSFILKAKIGRDAPLIGDIRLRARDNHQVVYLETDDAGALFRFTDAYPRMFGGQMWVAMDPPNAADTPQVGVLSIRNFAVRGEPGLERVIAGAPESARNAVAFSEMRADFTRQAGRMTIRDGVVRGPTIGATIDGTVDFAANTMRLRGTFVPLYAINNMFGQIPIVGLFLGGGSKEGLLGINYEASGPPSAPRITVNPISAVAPGLLRKMLPAPSPFDPNFVRPTR
jgi:hypothetical protein